MDGLILISDGDCCESCHYFKFVDIENKIGVCGLHKKLVMHDSWCSNGIPKRCQGKGGVMDISEFFRQKRFSSQHVGLGDVRLTIADQEEIASAFVNLRAELEAYKVADNGMLITINELKKELEQVKQERDAYKKAKEK